MSSTRYHLDYQRKRYAERVVQALQFLGHKCVRCGSLTNLEFDHIDPDTKEHVVTTMLSKYSWLKIEKELKKCQLLCKGCHESKTAQENRTRSPHNKSQQEPADHGTLRRYNVFRCRCEACKVAKRLSR